MTTRSRIKGVPAPHELVPGRHIFRVPAASAPVGADAVVAIVHRGQNPEPAIAVVAGVHGDEVEGIRAVQRTDQWLRIHPPRGSVLLIPMANPAAFRAGSRRHPADVLDLNRAFPGDPGGSPGERMAARLFDAVAGWGFVLSLHSWFVHGSVTPYVEVPAGSEPTAVESREVAHRLGLDFIRLSDWHPGLLVAAAVRVGTPAAEVEIGGLGRLAPENEALYSAVVRRAMAARGVTDETPADHAGTSVRHHYIGATVGGLFVREANLREPVRRGQRVGVVLDPIGRTRQVVRAVEPGLVAGYREHPAVHEGDHLFYIFTPATR